MREVHVKAAGNDVIGKLQSLARKTQRDELPPKAAAATAHINVGDAKKVFETFFRNRAAVTPLPPRAEPSAGAKYLALCSLMHR